MVKCRNMHITWHNMVWYCILDRIYVDISRSLCWSKTILSIYMQTISLGLGYYHSWDSHAWFSVLSSDLLLDSCTYVYAAAFSLNHKMWYVQHFLVAHFGGLCLIRGYCNNRKLSNTTVGTTYCTGFRCWCAIKLQSWMLSHWKI